MFVHFLGATDTVTGSRYLVETDTARVLVDCGLFQGFRKLRERNWEAFPIDVASLDAVIVTHAHIDHTGYLPKLTKLGYRGPIHCTRGTRDLLRILLPDSGYLQEEDARRANRYGYTRHHPAEPLYTRDDAERCLPQLVEHGYDEPFELARGLTTSFSRAGHIIGSASVALRSGATALTFSGDVGRPNDPIMRAPGGLGPTDYLVIESTYGDRLHPPENVLDSIARIVNATVEQRGVIVVPAFAVGRAQHLLHVLAQLKSSSRIPDMPVYLDSPMSIDATGIFCDHTDDHRITEGECRALCHLPRYSRTPEQSKHIDRSGGPMIVISASGMATGGRILHHLRRFLPDERNTILMVGYQAGGTRGRALVDGAHELKIHGEYVRVRASIARIDGLSAHADYAELVDWLRPAALEPRRVFVTHGEPAASAAFRARLQDEFGWNVLVPEDGSKHELT